MAQAGTDEQLGLLLAGLADELHREADAGAAEIRREFAAAMREARGRAPRHELTAILAGLKQRRRVALAMARRRAAMEIQARRQAALRDDRRPRNCIRPAIEFTFVISERVDRLRFHPSDSSDQAMLLRQAQ